MLVKTAVTLINNLVYKPGWRFTAEDGTNRHEGAVRLRIDYPAHETSREHAKAGYDQVNEPYASFFVLLGDGCDDVDLYRQVANMILEIESHEMREYLRVAPTYWAPFHPHQVDGMRRWHGTSGDIHRDLYFGAA